MEKLIPQDEFKEYILWTELIAKSAIKAMQQTNISLQEANKIEIFNEKNLLDESKKDLEANMFIKEKIATIEDSIQLVKNINNQNVFLKGSFIINIIKRRDYIKKQIRNNYKKSNTNYKIPEQEKEKIAHRRENIIRDMNKLTEDLREYLP